VTTPNDILSPVRRLVSATLAHGFGSLPDTPAPETPTHVQPLDALLRGLGGASHA
jgi:hypothetical protein